VGAGCLLLYIHVQFYKTLLQYIIHTDLVYRYFVGMIFLLLIFIRFYKKVENFKDFPLSYVFFPLRKTEVVNPTSSLNANLYKYVHSTTI
jgi:hypothetical protein